MDLDHVRRALVVSPAAAGAGGLGRSAGDFAHGLRNMGIETTYIGPPPASLSGRLARTRAVRRAGGGYQRVVDARALRASVPEIGWDLAYAIAGSAPVERDDGVVCIHQSTHHPRVEWERLQRGQRSTGGRSDYTWLERRRREHEIKHADLIRVTSLAVRDQFLEAGVPEHKLVHGYPGIDLDRYSPGDKSGDLRIAYVGAFSMRKGLDIAIDLASRLPPRARINVVGGPVDPWSRRLLESAPFVRQDDVPTMLARSQLLILPSRSDAFANVVLEALAAGAVPIVSPEVGAAEVVAGLEPSLVVDLDRFASDVPDLINTLDLPTLALRARRIATGFERTAGAQRVVAGVVRAASDVLARRE